MKKFLIPFLFILASCITPKQMAENPQDFFYLPAIPLDWDGEYPVEVWRATIKLNEPFNGLEKYEYTLYKLNDPYQDSLYVLQVSLKPFLEK